MLNMLYVDLLHITNLLNMISRIKISNFKSIVDTELNLLYTDKKAPNGYKDSEQIYFLEPTKKNKINNRLAPVMALYGANASGKSNVIKALLALFFTVKGGLNNQIELLNLKPFYNKINFSKNGSKIELEFFSKGQMYLYLLEFTTEKIFHEKLICNGDTLFEIKDSKIINLSVHSKVNSRDFLERLLFESLDGNNQVNTFLTTVYTRLPNLNLDISNVIDYIFSIVILGDNYLSPSLALNYLAESKDNIKLKEALTKIADVIQKFDINIDRFEFNRQEFNPNIAYPGMYLSQNDKKIELYEIVTIHKDTYGNDVKFKLQEESAGTQLLFSITAIIISVLEKGGVLIVDELDKSLHPLIVKVILEKFKLKEYNKNNSQLITTLHTTDVLEHYLRTYEVGFVNKSFKKGTTIHRLSNYENRQELNFRDRYVFGMYRAKPNTQI